jgi:hypothetical protein
MERVGWRKYVNIQSKDDFEDEYSINQFVPMIACYNYNEDEDSTMIVDTNNIESNVMKVANAQISLKEVLNFIAG